MVSYMPANPIEYHVRGARKDLQVARGLQRGLRLGHYHGRNNGGDSSRRMSSAAAHLAHLPRRLQGLITEEHKLAKRLSENRDADQERPELQRRITAIRKEIREYARS
jgi:hypothetical protein